MGQPGRRNGRSSCDEFIVARGERGEVIHLSTPMKRNQHEIPPVAVSEKGNKRAQTGGSDTSGVVGRHRGLPGELQNRRVVERSWKGRPEGVRVPYTKRVGLSGCRSRVPRDTWNPVGSWEDHLPRLNTNSRPIVNKYREGKVKSTPVRGVK